MRSASEDDMSPRNENETENERDAPWADDKVGDAPWEYDKVGPQR